ncbi:hypothetical protein PVAG01_03231 [Phlyctema vagabunda]|uniref:Uncharacterized protein n=1 Tax=Phlyctema vagabunda TaxID=108571 RepID=A0ABR4PT90_9HELO
MASTNGVLSPPVNPDNTTSLNLAAKRKRDDSAEIPHHVANGTSDSNIATSTDHAAASQSLIRDLLDVLKGHDTNPSILERSLPEHNLPGETQVKRQKSEDSSILGRYASNHYTNIDQVLKDIDTAVMGLIESLQLANVRTPYPTQSPAQTELFSKISAFKKWAHDLVRREKALTEKSSNTGINGVINNGSYLSNGSLGAHAVTQINATAKENGLVLTVYGNASGAKQLFSSLQKTSTVDGKEVLPVLREAGLPNGIATTQIVPIQPSGLTDDKRRSQTLGELFPSPPTILHPQPPKPSKIASTRSGTVGWYQPSTTREVRFKDIIYFDQNISTGQWLDYSHAAPPHTKRKRDRAMSTMGLARPLTSDLEPEESEASKLDALFRSAYSGFAPTKDDSAAIVPEEVVNRIWWQRVGGKTFERLIGTVSESKDATTAEATSASLSLNDEEYMQLKKAVDNWDEEMVDPSLEKLEPGFEKSAEDKEVDEVLQGINELLETLNSFQRIRHLQIQPGGRPGLIPGIEMPTGTPTKPSDSEISTYETIRNYLTMMIASLPPYAVAKLDSDRLGELNVSTKIEVKVNDYKGVMEEDEATARAKAAAMNSGLNSAGVRPPSALSHRSSSAALYGNQYASGSRPAAPSAMPYNGATQTPVRQTSGSWPRPPNTAPVPYQAPRPASGASYRPGSYTQTPSYPHQTPRPVQNSYAQYTPSAYNGGGARKLSTPTHNYVPVPVQNYGNGGQGVPQTAPSARYGAIPGAYQPAQPIQNGMDYRYGNGMANRQPSPQKPFSPQPSLAQPPSRSFGTPTPSMAPSRPYLPGATPIMNGMSTQQQQYQRASASPYASSVMTNEQQASLMERQRAQLIQQQESQGPARVSEQARIAGQVNGQPSNGQGGSSGSAPVTVAAGL